MLNIYYIKKKGIKIIIYCFLIFYLIFYCISYKTYYRVHYTLDNSIITKTKPIFDKIKKEKVNENIIPKILFQTYHNKNKIPKKVYNNINKYAHNYAHIIYNDNEAIQFLKENYGTLFVNKFNNFRLGAYKADFLRYCWLYKHGGIYADIKTEFILPLDEIFSENNTLYTCLTYTTNLIIQDWNNSIYQGIIAVPPHNIIIKNLILKMLSINIMWWDNYHIICQQFYYELSKYLQISDLKSGKYSGTNFNVILYQENGDCNINKDLKPDQYGFCEKIYDHNGKYVIHGRYVDYPWK